MKKKIFALALATVMALSTVVVASAETLEDGLVGYYTFEDSLANTQSETGVAKLHNGGYGPNDTTLWNTAVDAAVTPTYAEGKNGKGYDFLGDDTTRGVGLELDLKLTEAWTISYWVKADAVASATSMVYAPAADNLDKGLSIACNWWGRSFPTARFWGGVYTSEVYLDETQTAADAVVGQWVYVTLTCAADGAVTLYTDGEIAVWDNLDQTKAITAGALAGNAIYLGVNYWDTSFNGVMDDVAIYNRALSATEVADLYEAAGNPIAEDEEAEQTGDVVTLLPVALLAVAAVAVVASKKRTVEE